MNECSLTWMPCFQKNMYKYQLSSFASFFREILGYLFIYFEMKYVQFAHLTSLLCLGLSAKN